MTRFAAILLALVFVGATPAKADELIAATQTCFSDSTSGKDRKLLARWVFLAIAAHPEMERLSAATPSDVADVSQEFADLYMRLVTEDCPAQMRALVAGHGTKGVSAVFEYLGKVAMLEVMTNQQVSGTISGFEAYLDQEKLSAALTPDADPEQ
ncbi:MAG: hypothetical protein CVU23_01000 [Betaproteobacteria bacterium HGW-Betaproteobacteria-17]|nr:MAG: hypothetical protein CVU23_01000 [Betaproteobacteria bacterium HGW-Betaproteobacteria-17]